MAHRSLTAAFVTAGVAVLAVSLGAQQPARDQSAPSQASGTAVVSGIVVAADTGRPLKRVRIVVSGSAQANQLAEMLAGGGAPGAMGGRLGQRGSRGGGMGPLRAALGMMRTAQTDEQGRYEIRDLPAGRYMVTASKTGFVDVVYGQRRPLRPGTPVEVADGQAVTNISFSLPRGSVITGQVLDEDAEPIARVAVTVLRYQYQNGERRLVPAGSDQTDDRGVYRVYGLPPGDYDVSAVSRLLNRPFARLLEAAGAEADAGEGVLGYAPTFYPGVTAPSEATPVSLALGQEMRGVDFQLRLVAMARVSGTVVDVDGSPLAGGNVILAEDQSDLASRASLMGRVGADGAFTIDNVPPGRYVLWARSRAFRGEDANYAAHSLVVGGQDIRNLVVALAPGAVISGVVAFDASSQRPPDDLSAIRVSLPAIDPVPFGGNQTSRVGQDGRFEVTGIPAGRRFIRVPSPPAGWSLKSVIVDGRDVADEPLDVRNGQTISRVQVVLTDRLATVAGSVTDAHNQPVFGYTVVLFSTDSSTWRPQSRMIEAVQPDQTGAYRFRGMPPGDYFLAAVDDVERGEWFDPSFLQTLQPGAVRVTVGDGGTVAQDLKVG